MSINIAAFYTKWHGFVNGCRELYIIIIIISVILKWTHAADKFLLFLDHITHKLKYENLVTKSEEF